MENNCSQHLSTGLRERAVIAPEELTSEQARHLKQCDECAESVGRYAVAYEKTPLEDYPPDEN